MNSRAFVNYMVLGANEINFMNKAHQSKVSGMTSFL